jgi:hypothetical protein
VVVGGAAEYNEGVRLISRVLKEYSKLDIDKVLRKREDVLCKGKEGNVNQKSVWVKKVNQRPKYLGTEQVLTAIHHVFSDQGN